MRGIVIAAGLGLRMRPLTDSLPKCMLPVSGRPLLHDTMDIMRDAGCDELVVVVGHQADRVDAAGAATVTNANYADNNILHSLMSARSRVDGPVICSYSDIWVEPTVYRSLLAKDGDIVIAVDRDWTPYYEGRRDHPVEEAENVLFDSDETVRRIGKHLRPDEAGSLTCGEFLGLWRMSAAGARIFCQAFEEIDARLAADQPFQSAANWRQAYITDMIQELVDREIRVDCAVIERGWAELDTVEDFERLPEISRRQRLWNLCGGP